MVKKFVIKNIFEKIETKKIKGKANDFPQDPDKINVIPLLTAGIVNQGLSRFAPKNSCSTILSNVISVSANGANSGAVFYQPNNFSVLQDAYAIQVRNYTIPNKEIGLYLTSVLWKAIASNHDWSFKAVWNRIKTDIVELPIKTDENNNPIIDETRFYHEEGYIPDFDFMEERITELEKERITELEKYLTVTGLNDYELTEEDIKLLSNTTRKYENFITGNVLNFNSSNGIFHAININIECEKTNNNHPYIVRTSKNNGIRGYISEDENHLNDGNTISFAQDTAEMFFQSEQYFTGNKIKILSIKNQQLTEKKALFIISCLKKSFSSFGWGASYDLKILKKVSLSLPIKTDNNGNPIIDETHFYHEEGYIPDFDFMEKYIKYIKKVVISNLIKYNDEMIKQMENII